MNGATHFPLDADRARKDREPLGDRIEVGQATEFVGEDKAAVLVVLALEELFCRLAGTVALQGGDREDEQSRLVGSHNRCCPMHHACLPS